MVAALCILGLFIYFFFWSKKVRKEHIHQWKMVGQEEETSSLEGIITQLFIQKKRFYHHYWMIEIEAKLYSEKDHSSYKVIWRRAYTPEVTIPSLQKKEHVRLRGQFRQGIFYANQILQVETEHSSRHEHQTS